MRALLLAVLAIAACGFSNAPISNAPSPGYPCGKLGAPCPDSSPATCCDHEEVCGGPPPASCPPGMCCFAGGGDDYGARRPHPQRLAGPR